MLTPTHAAELQRLLGELSVGEVAELMIAGLRRWRGTIHFNRRFTLRDAGLAALELSAQRRGNPTTSLAALAEAMIYDLDAPAMGGVVEFASWLVSTGCAIPLVVMMGGGSIGIPSAYWLTDRGLALADAKDEAHPLLPRFVERILERCPGLPLDVVGLLTDARACMDHGLLRPAIAVMGVAYEAAVDAVVQHLCARATLPAWLLDRGAAVRIDELRKAASKIFPAKDQREERGALERACNFADHLRARRNDASHVRGRHGFDDRAEVEEILVSAGRYLPDLWAPMLLP